MKIERRKKPNLVAHLRQEQGRRLRKLLHQQLEDRTLRHLPDTAIPTLAERLDYLDGILAREDRQLQQFRNALPPASPDQNDPPPDPDAL